MSRRLLHIPAPVDFELRTNSPWPTIESNAVFEIMSEPAEELFPETQPSFSGRPPRPPKITARGLEDWGDDPEKVIHIPDPVVVRDLAAALKLKPFKVVADLMRLRLFKTPDDLISFETAETIAQWHGYKAIQTFLF